MSIGVGFGDIVTAIRMCNWLYEHCFTDRLSAPAQYVQFGQEIRKLGSLLQELQEDVTNNARLRNASENNVGLCDLIRDFLETLKQCEQFLQNHSHFRWSPSNFITNLTWNTVTQSRVEELRERVQFHTRKIQFAVSLKIFGLAAEISSDVASLWDGKEMSHQEQTLKQDHIPEALRNLFRDAACRDQPQAAPSFSDWPLKEGSDALLWNYERSTRDVACADQNIQHYINLLKSHWILERLKASRNFRSAHPGSQYRRIILDIGRRICCEYERELASYPEHTLLGLDQAAYRIWVPIVAVVPLDPSQASEQEEKILELALEAQPGFRVNRLTLFRRSPTSIRLLRERIPIGSDVLHPASELVDPQAVSLIPWYALPASNRSFRVELRPPHQPGGTLYAFKTLQDTLLFQTAMTGYRVTLDMPNTSWLVDQRRGPFRSRVSVGTGRLQIWRWKPLSSSQDATLVRSVTNDSDSRSGLSRQSIVTSSTIGRVTQGYDRSLYSITEQPPGSQDGVDAVVAGVTFVPPMLVIVTESAGLCTISSIELDDEHRIDDTACDCARLPDSCTDLVIQNAAPNASRKKFLVRRASTSFDAAGNPRLHQWSLSVLGRPSPDERRPHRSFNDTSVLEKKHAGYLNLEFRSVKDRQRFSAEFNKQITIYKAERLRSSQLHNTMQLASNRPNRVSEADRVLSRQNSVPRTRGGSEVTINRLRRVSTEPPSLPSPPPTPPWPPFDQFFG